MCAIVLVRRVVQHGNASHFIPNTSVCNRLMSSAGRARGTTSNGNGNGKGERCMHGPTQVAGRGGCLRRAGWERHCTAGLLLCLDGPWVTVVLGLALQGLMVRTNCKDYLQGLMALQGALQGLIRNTLARRLARTLQGALQGLIRNSCSLRTCKAPPARGETRRAVQKAPWRSRAG